MSIRGDRRLAPALLLTSITLIAACASAEGRRDARVTIDTLPGGIVSVASSGPTGWTDGGGWRLIADGWLEGDVGEPGELVDPSVWTVDERGFVYVADANPAVIKVFDDRGAFVRTFGREGAGPGEFRVALIFARGGRVVVHDPRVSRVSVFDTSGTFVRSWVGACCYWSQPFIDTKGRLAIPTAPPEGASRAYLRFDTLGTLIDTLLAPPVAPVEQWTLREGTNMVMSTIVPFTPKLEVALDPAGRMIHGWSGAYRLAVGGGRGRDTTRLFGRAWTAEPLVDARRDATYDARVAALARSMREDEAAIRLQFEKAKIPRTTPAFAGLSVDVAGNTWVHVEEDSARTRLDVFDTTGVYLGPVSVPALVRSYAVAWGRDVMYVRQDTEEGYPRIMRYRVVRGW